MIPKARRLQSWMLRKYTYILWTLTALTVPVAGFAMFQSQSADWIAEYAAATPADAVARLQPKLDSGDVKFEFDENVGYLRSVLSALKIPPSSQSLVFSKTSFQLDKIAPWSPRAIYFNDDVYVGWVQGGNVIEVASVDPNLGAVFYTLNQKAEEKPKFERQVANCLQCHDSMLNTGGVPGFVVQSLYVDHYGYAFSAPGNVVSSDHTPFSERFGGWYVTGTHGSQVHRGNIAAPTAVGDIRNTELYIKNLNFAATANVTDLSKFFKTDRYLAKTSDIVAMMLLVHQTSLHTMMVKASYDPRTEGQRTKAEALVRGLLFSGEAPLTEPIQGSAQFVSDFSRLGPRDHLGRSLRDLDLNRRLLKYPLSYLIYSEGFEALPENVKKYVSRRLVDILTGKDDSPEFAHLSPEDRKAILEILEDTKPGFLDITAGQ